MGAVLLLSGCTSLNAYLYPEGRSGNRDTLPVRVEELTEMAQYCKEAYDNKDESSGIRNNEFSYTVKQTGGITILIFRGTDVISSGGKNIGTDIDARLWKEDGLTKRWYGKQDAPKVLTAEDFKQKVKHELALKTVYLHRGFRDASDWIFSDIKAKHKLEKTVYLTGHSLGGAIAQIIGLWLNNDGYNVQIYTFGSPKVSTTYFGSEPPHYRVALRNDPVPFVPPWPFLHSGISIDPVTLDWEEGGERNRGSFTKIDGRNHSINEYFDILLEHDFPQLCNECK